MSLTHYRSFANTKLSENSIFPEICNVYAKRVFITNTYWKKVRAKKQLSKIAYFNVFL